MTVSDLPIIQYLNEQWQLKRIGIYAKKRDTSALINLIKQTSSVEVRFEAISKLRELRQAEALPLFTELLNEPSLALRQIAVKALGEIGVGTAASHLIKRLEIERNLSQNGEDNIQDDILRSLGRMKDERAVEVLIKTLWEKGKYNDHERGIAIASLGQIRFESAVPTLIEVVKDKTESEIIHKNALWALREITGKDYESVLLVDKPTSPITTTQERMVVIIDYGMGNLHSVQKAIEQVGYKAKISSNSREIASAQAVVLPGVGAFKDAIDEIRRLKLDLTIRQIIELNKPFLGICLGMQLLFTKSYEDGLHNGLDILKGEIKKFPASVKIPHIGWNTITNKKGGKFPLLVDIPAQPYFYFVHSYYLVPEDESIIAADTLYGLKFPSIICQGNVYATQFHPEKSQTLGLKILKNFFELL